MRKLSAEQRRDEVARAYLDTSFPIAERSSRALAKRYGVSHRTILNDLQARGIEERHEKMSGAGTSRAERLRRVAELYPKHTSEEVAAILGCADVTVIRDARELGLEIRKSAPRRKYPNPQPRRCECGSCVGEMFTPTAAQVKDGYGRFKDWDHYTAWKRSQVLAIAEEAAPLWNEGLTLDEIAEASPRLVQHRVWRALRVAKAEGLKVVIERRRGKQPGRYHEHGQLVKCRAREFDWCPHGETERWVFDSVGSEFLSQACWARYRAVHARETLIPIVVRPGHHLTPAKREEWWEVADAVADGGERQRFKNRLSGQKENAHRPRATTIPGYAEKREKVIEAVQRVGIDDSGRPRVSERALERMSGLARRQVRAILAELM